MRVRAFVLGAALSLADTVVPANAANAAAEHAVSCGETVTTNGYLSADLTCTGDGLTLAGNVTVNLRGHRLIGSSGTALTVVGESSLTIRNGRIEGWATGLTTDQRLLEDPADTTARTVTLSRVSFDANDLAVNVTGTGDYPFSYLLTTVNVDRARFTDNREAIGGVFTGPVNVTRSTFLRNKRALDVDTGGLTLSRSTLQHNDRAVSCVESGCVVDHVKFRHNPTAISLGTSGVDLSDSVIADSGTGLDISAGLGVRVKRTAFVRNTTAVSGFAVAGTFTDNRFFRNHTGYTTSGGSDYFTATLERNEFRRNYDAITTADPGTSLGHNLAVRNQHYGIYAPQAVDLGGNRAYGNGQSPQCVGVAC